MYQVQKKRQRPHRECGTRTPARSFRGTSLAASTKKPSTRTLARAGRAIRKDLHGDARTGDAKKAKDAMDENRRKSCRRILY